MQKSKVIWRESDTTYCQISTILDSVIDHRGLTATKIGGKWENNKGIPVISANNVRNGLFVEMDSVKRINADLFEKWMPVKLKKGDVLLVSEGATFGELLYLGENLKAALGQRLFALRCNRNYYGKYLYYYLKSKKGQQELSARTTGTSVLGIRQSELRLLLVPEVCVEEQTVIGDTLGAIDDKIRINQEMSRTLEAVGQAIFKRWFVDFEFPNEEGKPYKSSGGEMIDSEVGLIPKDWSVLNNIFEACDLINYGYTQSASAEEVGPRFLRVMDINKADWIDWNNVPFCEISEKDKPKYLLKKKDIVIARMADPGKIAIFESDFDVVFASYLIRIRLKSPSLAYYFYYLMKSPYYQNFIEGAATGSVQKNLNAKSLTTGLQIAVPSKETTFLFNSIVENLRAKVNCSLLESTALAKIRDGLLPKLMSGKIRVPIDSKMERQ